MTNLSPTAQAVVTAIEKFDWEPGHFTREDIWMLSREVTAAALRVISEFVRLDQPLGDTDADAGVFAAHQFIHGYITEIADELEAQ